MEFNPDGSIKIPRVKEEIDEEVVKDISLMIKEFESKWENSDYKERYEKAIEEIKKFNQIFPINKIKDLTLNEYCEGIPKSFCYWVDKGTIDVAHIHHHGFNMEFGLWFNPPSEKYQITSNRGKIAVEEESAISRLEELKIKILTILNHAKNNEFSRIDDLKMPRHQAKMKMIYLYYPDKLIPIMSKEQIRLICNRFNVSFDQNYPIESSHKLLNKLKQVDKIKDWHTQKISIFMYFAFPELNASKIQE